MRRLVIPLVLALAAGVLATGALADHNEFDIHSDKVTLLRQRPNRIEKDVLARGSDLAFQGNLMVAGTYEGTSLFKILPRRPYLRQIGFHACPGSQGDVSVWGKYVYVSIDSPSSNNGDSPVCNNTDDSMGKEGIRIIDISDPTSPRQVKFVETDCGSHTHTLVPHGDMMHIYIESYPLGAPTAACNQVGHSKISVIAFPKADPRRAEVVGTPSVAPAIGCHDVTAWPARDVAVAACISESQVWDITDPANPQILAHIPNPEIQIHHSSAITWDGKVAVIGDEFGGGGAQGCSGDEDSSIGAMWFYDITDPANPTELGHHALPRRPPTADDPDEAERLVCTTHNFNVLPMRNENRYVAVSAYYAGGMSVVDFSDPADAREVGFYLPIPGGSSPEMWSAYWYNGRIYTNDFGSRHGVRAFRMKGKGHKNVWFFSGRLNPQLQIASFE